MSRPKIADIARETGLTIGTVSRALDPSGKYPIAKETRGRVLEAAHRLGYRPHLLGRALAAGKSNLLLLLTPNPFTPYYVEINRHLTSQAAAHGYQILAASHVPSADEAISGDDWLYGVDGLILCDGLPGWRAHVAEAVRLKIPVVGMGTDGERLPYDHVSIDLGTGTRKLIEHLLAAGCRTPTLLATPRAEEGDLRYSAYMRAADELGFVPRVIEAQHQTRPDARRAVVRAYRERPFDGLACENDLIATGALRGLTDLGQRVPDDVRLAGCDGLEESSFQIVPITTLVQPIERMCAAAWKLLQSRMEGEIGPPRRVPMTAVLEIRESTSGRSAPSFHS